MYELVWKGSRFQVVRSQGEDAAARRRADPKKDAEGVFRGIDRAAWRDYVLRGRGSPQVQELIRQSWSRCLDHGVDPAEGKCWDIRYEQDLGEEYRFLKELTRDIQTEIYTLVQNRGLLVTVSDRRGYLAGMVGDIKALRAADKLNFGPGANWGETTVGTNAIGTALRCAHALQVRGREHFCETHHGWICSAAPIFDWNGELFACFDISGPLDSNHHRALDLAMHGARMIESRLYRFRAAQEAASSSPIVQTVLHAAPSGLLYADASGRIVESNPMASALLGVSRDRMVGARLEQFFHIKEFRSMVWAGTPRSRGDAGIPVPCLGTQALKASAFPVTSPNGSVQGALILIEEAPPARRTTQLVGAAPQDPFRDLLGHSTALREAVDLARRVASTDTTVLLVGESGTGKEILAKAIHAASRRADGPFVAVNCGAIPSGLIQSVLFGYVEGAFTGARRGGSPGKFEQAHGGTLFLDEIAEMPLDMQVNLLRVLEEGQVTRVGGTRPAAVDVRIIAATHRDLAARVREGLFREDLYYRLHVVRIVLPPLRERGEDVLVLARHFIELVSRKLGRSVRLILPSFYRALAAHGWPGNVRELRHAVEAAVALMPGDVLGEESLPDHVRGLERAKVPEEGERPGPEGAPFDLRAVEAETIRRAYAHFRGNITETARALGIGRNTLYAKLRKLGIPASSR
ncbi:MAG: sigma 54-interacting transcriptional regulator [Desulfosoma sp.]